MIIIHLFTIVLEKGSNSDPALYYNHVTKQWVDSFQLGCGCTNEEQAESVLKEVDVAGAYILEGDVNLSEEEEQ